MCPAGAIIKIDTGQAGDSLSLLLILKQKQLCGTGSLYFCQLSLEKARRKGSTQSWSWLPACPRRNPLPRLAKAGAQHELVEGCN